jgi:hypothetical protein
MRKCLSCKLQITDEFMRSKLLWPRQIITPLT